MLSSLKRAWRELLGAEDGGAPARDPGPEREAAFALFLGKVHVGVLSLSEGQWKFVYSDEFRRHEELRPLVSFPDKTAVYQAEELWPFFAMRIPSLKQPAIRERIEREHIDQRDRVKLLRRFGARTIANPYRLEDATARPALCGAS
ncbi:MAG: HipA N-terminal domain-containing protein [Planctomycetia bacterium]|jgi:HipA-like protein